MFARSALALAVALPTLASAQVASPATPQRPVTDEYHGTKVVDPYRWLEDWSSPEVKAWSDAQNSYARAYLDSISIAPALRERVTELENAVGDRYGSIVFANGAYFATKSVPGKQQPMIVTLPSLDSLSGERVIVDPNTLDTTGGTSFDWFVPSPDGRLVAVSLSSGGSESGDARVFDVATGKELDADRVPRVNGGTAGGALAWTADSSGFFYSRYPRAGEKPEADLDFYTQVYFHRLGTPGDADTYQSGKDYPKIAEIKLEVSHDGAWALANVQNGDGGEFIQDVRTPAGKWVRLSTWADRVVEAKFGRDGALYLVSRKHAPNGKILRLPLNKDAEPSLAAAKELIPERSDASVATAFPGREGIYLSDSRLHVLYQVGGPNELQVFDIAGGAATRHGTLASLPVSTIGDIEVLPGNAIVYQNTSFIDPPAYFTLTPGKDPASPGDVRPTAIKQAPPPHMPELEVRREFATSKDGTKVPVNIVRLKNAHSEPLPALLTAYGGYGVSQTPQFSRRMLLFVEQGGVYALANIRGGGEYGERWHLEGNLTKKQNVFDDFQAAADYLVRKRYTSHDKLAIIGGSNGGLLMGATFTQRPDICRAVVSSVGIYDMLRVELSANGAFNVTEFGTVKDKAQFDALFAYSPYHRVKTGTRYPAILFTTGANDPRVDPMQSRKMTAALQQAQAGIPEKDGGPSPVYLRTSANTGHGMGTPLSARIEQTVDTFGFIFEQLGMDYHRPGSK